MILAAAGTSWRSIASPFGGNRMMMLLTALGSTHCGGWSLMSQQLMRHWFYMLFCISQIIFKIWFYSYLLNSMPSLVYTLLESRDFP